jgi:hypothetical protein
VPSKRPGQRRLVDRLPGHLTLLDLNLHYIAAAKTGTIPRTATTTKWPLWPRGGRRRGRLPRARKGRRRCRRDQFYALDRPNAPPRRIEGAHWYYWRFYRFWRNIFEVLTKTICGFGHDRVVLPNTRIPPTPQQRQWRWADRRAIS